MSPDLIPRNVVNAAMRAYLPFFAIACLIVVSGLCSLALARIRSRDRLLVWFGVLAYAGRSTPNESSST